MRALRYVAALVALVVFAQTAHWTLVAHSVCAVHGELSHDSRDDADHDGHTVERSDHEQVTPGAPADEDHDHCLGVWTDHAILTESTPVLTQLLDAFALTSVRPESPVVARRLWLLAPKTSPPSSLVA